MSDMYRRPTRPRVSSESEQSTTTCEHAWRRIPRGLGLRLGLRLGLGLRLRLVG